MRFRLSPGSFFQINTQQTEVLYDVVKSFAGRGQGLLDLYGGAGGIALWLADQFEQVVGVDDLPSAVADAEQNAHLNRMTNTYFVAESAERFISHFRHPNPSRDLTVILDPPRAGCHPRVLQALTRIRPSRLIYVSCDPGTLSRDLKYLNQADFTIRSVQPVDLFPQTPHIETVVEMALRH